MAQTTATVTSVSAAVSAVTLFAPVDVERYADSAARFVFNDSAADLYLKYGAGASSSSFTVKVPAFGFWEAPTPAFDGLITGVWSSASGAARCTEVT